eukprot:m51a1_g10530 hypothetical protein (100) ;mRNA; f:235812-236111
MAELAAVNTELGRVLKLTAPECEALVEQVCANLEAIRQRGAQRGDKGSRRFADAAAGLLGQRDAKGTAALACDHFGLKAWLQAYDVLAQKVAKADAKHK